MQGAWADAGDESARAEEEAAASRGFDIYQSARLPCPPPIGAGGGGAGPAYANRFHRAPTARSQKDGGRASAGSGLAHLNSAGGNESSRSRNPSAPDIGLLPLGGPSFNKENVPPHDASDRLKLMGKSTAFITVQNPLKETLAFQERVGVAEDPPCQRSKEDARREDPRSAGGSGGRVDEPLPRGGPAAAVPVPATPRDSDALGDAQRHDHVTQSKGRGVCAAVPPLQQDLQALGREPEQIPTPSGKGKGKGPSTVPPRRAVSAPSLCKKPRSALPQKADAAKPSVLMKRLFWHCFTLDAEAAARCPDMVWAAIGCEGAESFDTRELERLFAEHRLSNGRLSIHRRLSGALPARGPPQRLRVFSEARRRQVCVMLARLPPVDATILAVTTMDDTRLDRHQVELLLENAPTADEVASLRRAAAKAEHSGEDLPWDDAEAFVLRLSEVPAFAARLQLWAFENSFEERFEIFRSAFSEVRLACQMLRTSTHIRRLLSLALAIGNYLNAGTTRGCADGFSIEAFAQMSALKTTQPGSVTTLVDFFVQQHERAHPGSLHAVFAEGGVAQAVNNATRHKLPDLVLEFSSYRTQADDLAKHALSAEDSAIAGRCARTRARLQQLASLQELSAETEDDYAQLCSWFHEGGSRGPRASDEFFGLWHSFLQAVHGALESACAGRARRPTPR